MDMCIVFNRKRPNWKAVVQPENDLFEPEIQPNLPENFFEL